MNATRNLATLLVLISVGQLSLSAPTGAPTSISNAPSQEPVSLPQPRGRVPLADRLSADDFIVSEIQYQQLLDRLYEESSASPAPQSLPNESDFNSRDFVAQDASIEEILHLIEESNQPSQPDVPANDESVSHDHHTDNEERDGECAICLEGNRADRPKIKLNCGHEFHIICIYDWYHEQTNYGSGPKCPICRDGIMYLRDLLRGRGLTPSARTPVTFPDINRTGPFARPTSPMMDTHRRASPAGELTTELYVPTPTTIRSFPTSTSRSMTPTAN